ncbi:meiotic nuclear division-like protein [Ceratobasidium sp. AG-Ba]|nr:meiotic nuclear division-like protein [Ceratobasidium sp. AG-Ba]QRW11307.1 meiotic nuclear division-like protein [Ceratobasidium sp. AG-Ba]
MEIEKETTSRLDTPTRRTSMTLLQAKREALSASKAELAQHGLADPALLEQKRRAVVLAHEAALRHTDNYSAVFQQLVNLLGCNPEELRGYLGVTEEYEDLE